MFRRDLFKMLGAAVASVVCAPLAKLLPERKPVKSTFSQRFTTGQILRIRKPVRYFADKDLALSAEDFTKRYTLPAIRKIADEYEADHAFVTGDSWPS